tara:strand:+ start:467 stop:865 length:399 start_codon:yes stop_codon:yes gene_type:complete
MDFTGLIEQAFSRGDLLGLFGGMIMLGLGLYVKMRPSGKPDGQSDPSAAPASHGNPNERFEGVVKQLEQVDKRLSRVENDLDHMPTNEDFHKMDMKFEQMRGRMMSIERTAESTGRAVGRIEDFLLSMKRDK